MTNYKAAWKSPRFDSGCFIANVIPAVDTNDNEVQLFVAGLISGEVVMFKSKTD